MNAKRPTMRDVAQSSGVSTQTVSRVINGDIHVSSKTRSRVLRAINELKFRPNRAAQSLVTKRSHILEVIIFGSMYFGPDQTINQVEVEAKALGYSLMV